jgi:nitrite reductase/ring-hydroxylating ferredoxin subunit
MHGYGPEDMLARALTRLVDRQARWAAPWGKLIQRLTNALLEPVPHLRDFLHGTWLGHSLHAALTDVPIGAMTLVIVLDLVGQSGAADVALGVVVLTMLAAAVTGAADHADTVGRERNTTTVHATVMSVALVLLVVALVIRVAGGPDRSLPIVIGMVGYLVMIAGAWVGGEAVYSLGVAVDRHAWLDDERDDWRAIDLPDLPQGRLTSATAGDLPLVVVRDGEELLALHDVCAHAGGPLSQGSMVDGVVECPWHGSRFDLRSGALRQGPSTHDQPAYEIRPREAGGHEVRRRIT